MYDVKKGYEAAKEFYAQYGIDVDKAIEIADKTPISMHLILWRTSASMPFGVFISRLTASFSFGAFRILLERSV